ncbi:hypothetical protein BD309DRAFT_873564 [Dichomitus squalens]|uniref:Uncharacterized protein n=1 Tax=Dichomitus squalens TaxID=114155 RepID=A0A4Q9NCU7_9APHY|nr:hypothetical protein BD309DRAFT_873564 [Dichomitus squalens]TBU63338.1 hypothetical protein BD310DRAFT_870139 [Dichomitus squalens]
MPLSPSESHVVLSTVCVPGVDVTEDQLKTCAALFSQNYSVWAPSVGPPLKAGGRVRMNATKLRAQCLSNPEDSVLVLRYKEEQLVGHAFATKWACGTDIVGWITQLVVVVNERRKYIATSLLQALKDTDWFAGIAMMGVVSSQPATCHALCKMFSGLPISDINLDFIRQVAAKALKSSTVQYLRNAQLHGSLFEDATDGSISLANTEYFIDHDEPNAVLRHYIEKKQWPLGILKEGHEFAVVIPTAPLPA